MSAISDIFDAMHTKVAGVLTTHSELLNPYFIERDSQITLSKGYGIRIGLGDNLNDNENSGNEQRQRTFVLVLTRRKFATKADVSARKTVEKNLLEDLTLVLDAIAQDTKLGLSAVQRTLYITDTGVQFLLLNSDRNDIYFLEATFEVDYEDVVQLCT